MVSFQIIRMSSYAKNELQMCWVNEHQCRSLQNVENIHKFTHYTHFLSITKNDLSWLNNLFMVSFQLIKISSYAKYKQQMCWVTQYHCRSRRMWNIFTNSPSTLTFCLLQKMTTLAWTIYSWLAFNSLGCPLSQRINYRCVESLDISVEVAKCGKFSHIHPVHSLFVLLQKITSVA